MTSYSIVAPQKIETTIDLPRSKSISNRLLILSQLAGSMQLPSKLSDSDDTDVMTTALRSDMSHVDIGAAGTSMRFLTAYLATKEGQHYITGSERMKQRPIALLVDALRSLGARIEYTEKEGFPPLQIEGGSLRGNEVCLPGNVSSQYISALMMIGPTISGGLRIRLEGEIGSRPYIEMTKELMRMFGAEVGWTTENIIEIGDKKYTYVQTEVEADWSAASYWYSVVALCPGAVVRLQGLQKNSLQGDKEIANIMRPLGVESVFETNGDVVLTHTGNSVVHYEIDFASQPDLAQTLVCLCPVLGVRFKFTGLASLRIKETDRMMALIDEMRKFGYVIKCNGVDTMMWDGEETERAEPIVIKTYKDHRMAMAFAPLSLRKGKFLIDEPSVVSKSYPTFWQDMAKARFEIKEA